LTIHCRFFSVRPIGGDCLTLDGDEFHHVTTGMRARAGEELEIADGHGHRRHPEK
jgi:16S rRNA U1498 N3-methylase RsmE